MKLDNQDKLRDATIVVNLLREIPQKYKKRLIGVMQTNDLKKISAKCKKIKAEADRELKNK